MSDSDYNYDPGNFDFSGDDAYRVDSSYASLGASAKVFKPGVRVTELNYGWQRHKHPIIFQPIPQIMSDSFMPSVRMLEGELKCGSWLLPVPHISQVGSAEKISCILFDPAKESRGSYSASDNPFIRLRRKCYAAARDGVRIGNFDCKNWMSLFVSASDKDFACFPNVKPRFFAQCLGWHDGNELLLDERMRPLGLHHKDETLAIVSMSQAAGNTLIKKLIEFYSETGVDPFAIDHCRFVGIYNEANFDAKNVDYSLYEQSIPGAMNRTQQGQPGFPEQTDAQAFASQNQPPLPELDPSSVFGFGSDLGNSGALGGFGGFGGNSSGGESVSRYGVTLAERARIRYRKGGSNDFADDFLRTNNLLATFGPEINRRYRRWGDLLRVPCHEELCIWLAKAFSDKPLLLEYGWADTEYLNQEVIGILRARSVHPVGALDLDDSISGQSFGGGSSGSGFGAPVSSGNSVYSSPQQHMPANQYQQPQYQQPQPRPQPQYQQPQPQYQQPQPQYQQPTGPGMAPPGVLPNGMPSGSQPQYQQPAGSGMTPPAVLPNGMLAGYGQPQPQSHQPQAADMMSDLDNLLAYAETEPVRHQMPGGAVYQQGNNQQGGGYNPGS